MSRFAALLYLLLAGHALALPAEDHWSADPDTPFARDYAKAKDLIEVEAFGQALPILQRLAVDEPGNADVFNLLGFAYRKTGDLDNSAPAYARALFLNPDHLGALEYQGELYLVLGDVAAAEANLARLTDLCTCEERDELAEAIANWRATRD